MPPKYFYYISRTKVDMLLPQLRRGALSLPSISPKVEFAGISVGADFKQQIDGNLIEDTLKLLEALQKKKLISELSKSDELKESNFYGDKDIWLSGICSFRAVSAPVIATYLLWKLHADSIILLVGSPSNILGDKIVEDGIWAPGTGAGWKYLLSFVTQLIQTDEPSLVGMPDPKWDTGIIRSRQEEMLGGIPLVDLKNVSDYRGIEINPLEFTFLEKLPSGIAIAMFCRRYLHFLPQANIDTVFRVFRRIDLPDASDSLGWLVDLGVFSQREVEQLNLEKYKTVYIGSPIYTALA